MDFSLFQRDTSEISASLAEGLERLQYGSYADRNPGLGRMVRCPHCRQRRREFITVPCCNASHATTKRVWNEVWDVKGVRLDSRTDKGFGPSTRHEKNFYQEPCPPRVVEAMLSKAFIKKITHKKHSNLLRHQVHDMVLELQNEEFRNTTQLLLEGLPPFHEPTRPVDLTALPAYAERVIRAIRKTRANVLRKQQQRARRINFGLV